MARGASGLLIVAGLVFIGSGLSIALGCGVVASVLNLVGVPLDCGSLFILPLAVGFILVGLGIFVALMLGGGNSD